MEENTSVYTIGDRNIYLSGEINTKSTSEVITKLMATITNITNQACVIRDYEIGHINLFIQSQGGSIHDMWALIDLMMSSPIPIYTYAVGLTASAALKIFLAGAVRFVMPNSVLMYHELSAGNSGKLQNVTEWQDYLEKEQEKVEKFVRMRTHLKPKKLKEIKEKKLDYYIYPDEAIELGFATNKFECPDWGEIIHG